MLNIFGLNSDISSLDIGCSQMVLSINDQQNNIYVTSGTIVTFKVCGYPNADFIIQNIIQNVGIGGNEIGDVNLFYPYDIIDRGKLDPNGIHISSIPLNKAGTYIFRAGIWCTIADIDYCTQVSNAIMVIVLEKGCTPNYVCRQPLDGYEYDANHCGESDKLASRCNPNCGGTGCDNGNKGGGNLLKIGAIVIAIGVIVYYTSRNGFRVRLRDKRV